MAGYGSMLPATRRSQPYRRGRKRPAGSTLAAMLRGRPANRLHPLEARRKAMKARKASARRPYNRA